MSDNLYNLMETGRLSPLAYYFAHFITQESGQEDLDSLLAHSAALVSMRNLQGDVCVDLAHYTGRPLFEETGDVPVTIPHGPPLDDWLEVLNDTKWVGDPNKQAPLVLEGTRLYLGKYWRFEHQIAKTLLKRMEPVRSLDLPRLAAGLTRLFPHSDPDTLDWQKIAAAIAVSRRFAVISGGPGTGKTTTVVKVLTLLLEQDPKQSIALAAPTGKAAARLSEAVRQGKINVTATREVVARIPEEASTIHRLLGVGLDGCFLHNRENPLFVDCLVVDEASMIDMALMARLLEALPDRARIILLGDRDQLASVEAGNVLGDITGHGQAIHYSPEQVRFLEQVEAAVPGRLPCSEQSQCSADSVGLLRVSYRFPEDSGIGKLSQLVNGGQGEAAKQLLEVGRFGDIEWIEAKGDELHPACIDWAVERYSHYLQQVDVAAALGAFEKIRVLAALRRGPFGVEEINRQIAARLQSCDLIQGGEEYHGKPVMVTINDYEVGLFNGDIGLLWRDENNALRVYFLLDEHRVRSVSVRQLPAHECAYALTVHKSQGSEFDEVLLVLPFDKNPVLTRELIYTGITRAKKKVTIQGNRAAFLEGCRSRVQRSSALAEKLGWVASQ